MLYAKNIIEDLIQNFSRDRKCLNKDEYEYRNMLTASILIVNSALSRKESRGAHSRADYKQTDEIGVHSIMKKMNKEMALC